MRVPADGATLTRLARVVDDRYGVVRRVAVHDVGPTDPPLFFATAELASTRAFSDAAASALNGGAGVDAATAVVGALGEAIERYAIGIYRDSELTRAPFRAVEGDALDPRRLIFYADEQYRWPDFPYTQYDVDVPLTWVRGIGLVDGRERLVPACRVYTPYCAVAPAQRILQSTSTGAACHASRATAALAGLYECVERDAVMIAWLNRFPLPTVDVSRLQEPHLRAVLDGLRDRGLTGLLFDATSDLGIPTALALVLGPPGTVPALAVGAATRATLGAAAEKALVEGAHTFFWVHTRSRERGLRAFRADYADVRSLDAHSLLYGHPHMRAAFAFLLERATEPVSGTSIQRSPAGRVDAAPAGRVGDPPAASTNGDTGAAPDGAEGCAVDVELARCVAQLAAAGIEPVAVDVTPDDVRDLGFTAVRVVATDLHPLWGGHHVRCLGGRRVREVPVRLGYRASAPDVADFNPDPHPMP